MTQSSATIDSSLPPGSPSSGDWAAYARPAYPLGHSGMNIARYYLTHVFGALFPLTTGLMMYGWRSGLTVAAVMLPAAGALFVWRKIGLRGGQLRYAHVMWLALALALILPAHLAAHPSFDRAATWPILPLAGVLLVVFCWLLGGIGAGRIHPVVVTYLLMVVLYGPDLVPRQVLQRHVMVMGDLANSTRPQMTPTAQDAWLRRPIVNGHDAITITPAAEYLSEYTTGQVSPDRVWLSLEGLLRDRLPPLEDLILGAHPGPLGTTSAIAVIIGGLFLLYRGLIDYRIPLLVVVSCFIAMLVLPIPAVITDKPEWRWAVGHVRGVGWPMGVTLANYEILASPLLFTAFFLATASSTRPLTRRGRAVYSLVIGLLSAVFQLYVSVAFGSYLALISASLLTPGLDKWLKPRALV